MFSKYNGAGRLLFARPVAGAAAVIIVLLKAVPAGAETLNDQVCMEQAWEAGGQQTSLQCTASDIQITEVVELNILDDGCAYAGDTVELQASFVVTMITDIRWDIGVWFSQGGISALQGACSVASLPLDLDLDGTSNDPGGTIQDTCGDMEISSLGQTILNVELTVACVDQGVDEELDLTYCSSWRQEETNGLCVSPLDAFPGAPSKCHCASFSLPIPIGVGQPEGIFESGFESL